MTSIYSNSTTALSFPCRTLSFTFSMSESLTFWFSLLLSFCSFLFKMRRFILDLLERSNCVGCKSPALWGATRFLDGFLLSGTIGLATYIFGIVFASILLLRQLSTFFVDSSNSNDCGLHIYLNWITINIFDLLRKWWHDDFSFLHVLKKIARV